MREAAREWIAEIVARFQRTPKKDRDAMTEQQTRVSFILPLFRALGWDIEDPAEVSAEEQISRGFVDFGFYLNGIPVFYLETKRVVEKLEKREFMQQSINYSFNKGVTWAVLTDFEQLMVFNADVEERDPIKARFLDLHYENYATTRFDDLWLLSRESFQTGEINRLAERFGKKNKKEPVTKLLFSDLTDWRKRLFNDIRHQGTTLWATNSALVDNAVQKFFDRLIFLRTVEDRGVDESHLKQVLRQSTNKALYANILKLFREMNGVYNSNLFDHHHLDDMEVNDPDLLKEIINGLYKVKGGYIDYNFNAITADVLGAVYEQYLGFKVQDPDARTDAKQGKRKSQGIYYTPQYVVRYIVQQTVGKLLEEGADPFKLRILDPACGSGSFLIEAFDALDRHLNQQNPKATPEERAAWRRRILTENIYGVDLDEQAVEVTRLNLMLRAALQRGRLPLLTNIKHGNSLIDDPSVAGDTAFKWDERFEDVMSAGGFDVVIGNPPYVRQETLGAAFKDHVQKRYATYAGSADLYVYFIEKGINLLRQDGIYSVIVANKWLRASYGKTLRQWLKKQAIQEIVDFGDLPVFPEATTYPCIVTVRKADSPAETFHATQVKTLEFESLEEYVKLNRHTVQLAQQDDKSWSLTNENSQRILEKLKLSSVTLNNHSSNRIYYGIKTGLNEAFVIDAATRKALISKDPKSESLIKPFLAGRDIKRYETAVHEKYVILIPSGWTRVQSGDTANAETWFNQNYPAIAEHLRPFAAAAQKRWDKGEYWWELRSCDYYDEFEKPKILFPDISNTGNFALDVDCAYCGNTVYFIPTDDKYLLGLLNSRLLNFVYRNVFSEYRGGYLRFFQQYLVQLPIRKINFDDPADKSRHDQLVSLVEKMLSLKKQYAAATDTLNDRQHELAADIQRLDSRIDSLIYELYNLTPAEIQIVEGS